MKVVIERVAGAAFPQVVRVLIRAARVDLDEPWAHSTYDSVGVAAVIGPRWLLALASAVCDAVDPVAPVGPDQAIAHVVRIDHDRDLALLEVADSLTAQWGIEPFELDFPPSFQSVVLLAGFDEDGTPRSGHAVVDNIGLVRYVHSQRHLLAATIEARQEFSTGGDVAVRSGRLIGIVMQKLKDNALAGELATILIIKGFLDGARAGVPPGVPALGIGFQALVNPAMRARYGDRGVLVTRVEHGATCDGVLEPRDVIVSIGKYDIDDEGETCIGPNRLLHYAALCAYHIGDRIPLGVRRRGELVTLEVTLQGLCSLVPRVPAGIAPRYAIYAGLVLQPVTRDLLTTWDEWWNRAPKEFLHAYYSGQRTAERHELVAITEILEDPINAGYQHLDNESIARVGGVVPRDMTHLLALLDAAHGDFVIETSSGGLMAFHAAEARAATSRICEARGIPRERSVS